jgi:hypothetical protein
MKKLGKLRSIVKKTPYVKPKQPPKVTELKCHVCGEKATHVILIELREVPGPPLKENNVLRVVCEEHVDTNFDTWVSVPAYKALCIEWEKVGVKLNKQYCTIKVLELKNNGNAKSSN